MTFTKLRDGDKIAVVLFLNPSLKEKCEKYFNFYKPNIVKDYENKNITLKEISKVVEDKYFDQMAFFRKSKEYVDYKKTIVYKQFSHFILNPL